MLKDVFLACNNCRLISRFTSAQLQNFWIVRKFQSFRQFQQVFRKNYIFSVKPNVQQDVRTAFFLTDKQFSTESSMRYNIASFFTDKEFIHWAKRFYASKPFFLIKNKCAFSSSQVHKVRQVQLNKVRQAKSNMTTGQPLFHFLF